MSEKDYAKLYKDLVAFIQVEGDPQLRLDMIDSFIKELDSTDSISPSAKFVMKDRLNRYHRTIHHRMKG